MIIDETRIKKLVVVFEIDPSWEMNIIEGLEKQFGNSNAKMEIYHRWVYD